MNSGKNYKLLTTYTDLTLTFFINIYLVHIQNITDEHTSQSDLQTCQTLVDAAVQVLAKNRANANLGQSYSLSCIARGIDGLNHSVTYQWFKDQSLLPGEVDLSLIHI